MTSIVAHPFPKSLARLLKLRKAAIEAFDPLGFTLYQATILFQVEQGVERHNEIESLLAVKAVAVSALVTRLEKRQLLIRSYDAKDGRRVTLTLTPAGCDAVGRLRRSWEALEPLESEIEVLN